jgi:hypothetical protein
MNSLGGGSTVKIKGVVEKVINMEGPVSLHHPRECNGSLYVCSHAGEVIKFTESGDYQVYFIWGGQPSCNFL